MKGKFLISQDKNDKYKLYYYLYGTHWLLNTCDTLEEVEKCKEVFINEYDLNVKKYKSSIVKKPSGTICVTNHNKFQVLFYINDKLKNFGSFSTRELANEARLYFINECNYNIEKYKASKYWLELSKRRLGKKSYGTIAETDYGLYAVYLTENHKQYYLGIYKTKELAEEARQYFLDINKNIDEFKQSKYWLELRNGAGKKLK